MFVSFKSKFAFLKFVSNMLSGDLSYLKDHVAETGDTGIRILVILFCLMNQWSQIHPFIIYVTRVTLDQS